MAVADNGESDVAPPALGGLSRSDGADAIVGRLDPRVEPAAPLADRLDFINSAPGVRTWLRAAPPAAIPAAADPSGDGGLECDDLCDDVGEGEPEWCPVDPPLRACSAEGDTVLGLAKIAALRLGVPLAEAEDDPRPEIVRAPCPFPSSSEEDWSEWEDEDELSELSGTVMACARGEGNEGVAANEAACFRDCSEDGSA